MRPGTHNLSQTISKIQNDQQIIMKMQSHHIKMFCTQENMFFQLFKSEVCDSKSHSEICSGQNHQNNMYHLFDSSSWSKPDA